MTEPRNRAGDALALLRRLEQATADDRDADAATEPEVARAGEELWTMLNEELEADEHEIRSRETRMRARFYRELAAHENEPAPASLLERAERWLAGFWPSTRVAHAAVATFTLLVGVGLGLTLRRESEIVRLQREMSTMGQTVALALLDHSAATERLRGVSLGAAAIEGGSDDSAALAIADGLLDVVSYDSSENVRLAAVEALARIADRPRVRAGLVDALARQDSPMVQMTLADVVVASGDGSATKALRSLLERDDLEPAVRQRLEELLRASSGGESTAPRAKENA